jgi:hypothetical protein
MSHGIDRLPRKAVMRASDVNSLMQGINRQAYPVFATLTSRAGLGAAYLGV